LKVPRLDVGQVFNLPRGSLGRSNLRPEAWIQSHDQRALNQSSIGSPAPAARREIRLRN